MARLEITIEAPKLDRFIAKMKRFPENAIEAMEMGVRRSLFVIERQAKLETPVSTGRLRSGFRIKVRGLQGTIFNRVKYALFVHEGTEPHIILPVIKKALWWKGADHPVKKVNHPGTASNPFMERALKKTRNIRDDIFQEEIQKALEKVKV